MSTPEKTRATDDLRVVSPAPRPKEIDLREPSSQAEEAGSRRATARAVYRKVAWRLAAVDALCIVTALTIAHVVRFGALERGPALLPPLAVGLVLWLVVFRAFGLYAPHHLSEPEEFRRIIGAAGLGLVLVIILDFWVDDFLVARSLIGLTLVIALVLEFTGRRVIRRHLKRLRANGKASFRTLVIGSGPKAEELTESLKEPESGFVPLACVNPELFLAHGPVRNREVELLRELIREHAAECVFVASSAINHPAMLSITHAARLEGAEVRVYTRLAGVRMSRLTLQPMGPAGVSLAIRPIRLSAAQSVVKRTFDLAAAGLGLILLSPVIAAIAVGTKLSSPGPVLFRQKRVTEGGHVFHMLKFRTMREDADSYATDNGVDTSVPFFKMNDDPRRTPFGAFLRNTSLDELPQLVNVMKGEMSLVGPRPLPVDQVAANPELLSPRHEVRAGVTGWWQINGRSEVGPEEAIQLDLFYIENWSLTLDLYVLLRTAGALLKRNGAY